MPDTASRALTLRLSSDEHDALRAFAFVSDQSINDAIRRAIRLLLATEGAASETYALFDAAKGSYRLSVDRIAEELEQVIENPRSEEGGDA